MELKILFPDSNDYCEAVGITPERQQELSKALDAMVRRLDSQPLHLVKMQDIFAEILSFCTNEAESVYCTVLHCGWHARKGRILAPGPLNYDVIRFGIEQLYDGLRKDNGSESREIMGKIIKLSLTNDEAEMKIAIRAGVQRLLDLRAVDLARDIINKLTGFAF